MPGQTLIAGSHNPEHIAARLNFYCFDSRYSSHIDTLSDDLSIAWTQYSGYPIEQYTINGTTIWVEGCIYNHPCDSIDELLTQILEAQMDKNFDRLNELLLSSDGEYLITIISSANSAIVITDPLGRLPLGYYSNSDITIIARHKLLIADLIDDIHIDQFDAACYLHWGFAIGGRSLLTGVRRVPPASVVTISPGKITVDHYHEWRVDLEKYAGRSIKENAERLAHLFKEGCHRRDEIGPGETVALLSGGLDSRAILGALGDSNTFSATTRNQTKLDAQQDVVVAQKLADIMDVDWQEYQIEMPTADDIEKHIRMKGGLDPITTSHELPHLSELIDEYPGATLMSGSGGDKLLPDLRPTVSLSSDADAVEYIMESASRLPMETVSSITGVSPVEIREYLSSVIASYPEDDPKQKVIHFKIFERMYAWLYEAGDMNRCHLWNTSPFYTIEFFTYALGIPDEQREDHKLFAAWLAAVDERLVEVVNANTRTKPGSLIHRLQLKTYHFLSTHPALLDLVKPTAKVLLQGDNSDAKISYPVDIPAPTGTIAGVDITTYLYDESLQRGDRCQLLTLAYLEQLLRNNQSNNPIPSEPREN